MFNKSLKDFFKNPIITLPTLIVSLVVSLYSNIFLHSGYFDQIVSKEKPGNYEELSTGTAKFISFVLLMIIFYLLVNPLITSLTNVMIKKLIKGDKIDLSISLKQSLKFYWKLFGIIVLKILIFIGIMIVFFICSIPLLSSVLKNPSVFPVGFSLLTLFFVIACAIMAIIFMPVDTLLVYDDLSIGEAMSKGIKFGLKKFINITGVLIIIGIVLAIGYEFPHLQIVFSLISSYLGVFLTVYIMNLYDNNYKENIPLTKSPSLDKSNAPNEDSPENDSKFIV